MILWCWKPFPRMVLLNLDPESNSWVGAQGKVMTSYHGSDYLKIGLRYEMLSEPRCLNVNIVWLARADKHQSGWQWNQDQKSDNQRLARKTLRWFFLTAIQNLVTKWNERIKWWLALSLVSMHFNLSQWHCQIKRSCIVEGVSSSHVGK